MDAIVESQPVTRHSDGPAVPARDADSPCRSQALWPALRDKWLGLCRDEESIEGPTS